MKFRTRSLTSRSTAVLLAILALFAAAALSYSFQPGSGPSQIAKAEETLQRLIEGNQHYVSDQLTQPKNVCAPRRTEIAAGQHPSAVVLSCSDSRVPPEYIFDQGLGDLFVVRVAGNVADPVALGSIEYAVEHLHVPLVIVMGHDNCGAVSATLHGGKPEGNIRSIVAKIAPAVKKAKTSGKKGEKLLDAAVVENVRSVTAGLTRESKIIKHLVDKKQLKIVPAKYNLATGMVEFL
jgi:carbonic anhydrase